MCRLGFEVVDMVNAWTTLAPHAPGMEDLYEPSNFTEALHHMQSTDEERRKKFREDQQGRVSDSMLKQTKIMEKRGN